MKNKLQDLLSFELSQASSLEWMFYLVLFNHIRVPSFVQCNLLGIKCRYFYCYC